MMQNKPSNTREQCAFDRGVLNRQRANNAAKEHLPLAIKIVATWREAHNPHKKGSVEYKFWNEGFDSV